MGNRESAFDRCYKKHYTAILCYALSRGQSRADAEEIASETFVRLWNRWDERAGEDDSTLLKWLYVTAGHIIQEYRRHQKITVPLEEIEGVWSECDMTESLEDAQLRHYLREIERTLDPPEWELFRSAFLKRMPYDRIMAEQNIRSDALRVRIHRLRKKLKKLLPRLFES